MVHALPAPPPHVRHQPVTGVGNALGTRQIYGHGEDAPEQWPVGLAKIGGRRNVATRLDQDVRRGPRCDVTDRDHQVVVMQTRGWDLAAHDPAEQAVALVHHNTGFELIRKPNEPTTPAIRYDR